MITSEDKSLAELELGSRVYNIPLISLITKNSPVKKISEVSNFTFEITFSLTVFPLDSKTVTISLSSLFLPITIISFVFLL